MELILEFISNLLVNEGIVIAVAAFVVGQILKGFKKVPNNIIPLVGGLLGIILGITIPDIFVGKDIVTSGVLGLALGWAATGGYETIRNVKGGK
jgi:hypothetical protein